MGYRKEKRWYQVDMKGYMNSNLREITNESCIYESIIFFKNAKKICRTFRTPRRVFTDIWLCPLGGISLPSLGSLAVIDKRWLFGLNPKNLWRGLWPDWSVGTGGLLSKLLKKRSKWTADSRRVPQAAYPPFQNITHKVSNGTLTQRIASVNLWWSRDMCGTTPRDVVVRRLGVGICRRWFWLLSSGWSLEERLRIILPILGPYRVGLGDVKEKLSKVFFWRIWFIKMKCDKNVTSHNSEVTDIVLFSF